MAARGGIAIGIANIPRGKFDFVKAQIDSHDIACTKQSCSPGLQSFAHFHLPKKAPEQSFGHVHAVEVGLGPSFWQG